MAGTTWLWLAVGGVWLTLMTFGVSICAAAARGDRIAQDHDEPEARWVREPADVVSLVLKSWGRVDATLYGGSSSETLRPIAACAHATPAQHLRPAALEALAAGDVIERRAVAGYQPGPFVVAVPVRTHDESIGALAISLPYEQRSRLSRAERRTLWELAGLAAALPELRRERAPLRIA
jgi:hypothetical protein